MEDIQNYLALVVENKFNWKKKLEQGYIFVCVGKLRNIPTYYNWRRVYLDCNIDFLIENQAFI